MTWVGIDDELVPAEEASLSVFDAGLLHGAGLFETMRIEGGLVVDLDRHLERLERSAAHFGLVLPSAGRLRERLERWRQKAGLPRGTVRLTVTAGSIAGRPLFDPAEPRTIVFGGPLPPGEDDQRRRGVHAVTAPFDGGACAGHKTLSYLPWWAARRSALEVDEVILIDRAGRVLEGATSNVFAVVAGEIRTPPELRILPGIARRRVIELAAEARIPIRVGDLLLDELSRAEELFLTRSTTGIVPVIELGGSRVGAGEPGGWTRRLQELQGAWWRASERGESDPEASP